MKFLFVFLFVQNVFASSIYDLRATNGHSYLENLQEVGVNPKVIKLVFDYFDKYPIQNKKVISFIDYSIPSDQERLFILHVDTGDIEKHLVAHGRNSGDKVASKFSNIDGSLQSSLGMFITGAPYIGKHKESMYLNGIEKSNNKAMSRNIVLHGADYVSYDFANEHGRVGRSWGCPAVPQDQKKRIIAMLRNGSLFYTYASRSLKL